MKVEQIQTNSRLILPNGDEVTRAMHQSDERSHTPASSLAVLWAYFFGVLSSAAPIGSGHFDIGFNQERLVVPAGVVGFVAVQSCMKLVEEAPRDNVLHKVTFGWRCAEDPSGHWKAAVSVESDHLGAFFAADRSNWKIHQLTVTKVSSMSFFSELNSLVRADRPRADSDLVSIRRYGISRHCIPIPTTPGTPFNIAVGHATPSHGYLLVTRHPITARRSSAIRWFTPSVPPPARSESFGGRSKIRQFCSPELYKTRC